MLMVHFFLLWIKDLSDCMFFDFQIEICLNLKNIRWVDQVLLEHQLHNKRNFKTTFKIIPDALLKIDTYHLPIGSYNILIENDGSFSAKRFVKTK